jgi:hypothetical protein
VVAEEVAVPREKKRMMDAYIHACMHDDRRDFDIDGIPYEGKRTTPHTRNELLP